jgi:hypothetical protein
MDLTKGYDFIYSCNGCCYNERVTQWSMTLNYSCDVCKSMTRELIGIINKEGQSLFLSDATEEEREAIVNKHDKLLTTLKKANKIVSKQSMRDRLRSIEYKVVSLREHLERIQAHVNTLSETIGKSESLLFTLLDTKQGAVKTIETLADTIKTQDRELVAYYETFTKDKREMLDLLLERNNILLELNGEED